MGTGNDAFYLPAPFDTVGNVVITGAEVALLACPGGFLTLNGVSTGLETAEATCASGSSFNVNGQVVPVSGIACSRYPFHTARYTGNSCLGAYKEIEVGWEIGANFIRQLTICFDDVGQNSLYTLFDMPAGIGGYQSGFPRPGFIQDDFYNVGGSSVDSLYSRSAQTATINSLLGLSSGDTTWIHPTNDYFLSRGHLAAKADFVYGNQHRATFHFVNVAPQWQTNNGGNWNTLEMNVRSMASARGLNLLVWTGTHGVSKLPHSVTGEPTELYLYVDANNNRGLPVPEWYWKVVYDPATREGVALLTLNNPYQDTFDQICTNVCDQITWLTWQPTDQKLGYSYCCNVAEFLTVVPEMEAIEVVGLLA